MKIFFFKKLDSTQTRAFREIALHHNIATSKVFAAIIGIVSFMLCMMDQTTKSSNVLKYPSEYSAAITFLFWASVVCFSTFLICKKINERVRNKAYSFLTNFYAIIIIISSLWITFVMQHNPSNTMSIFVLGILSVAALWIFEEIQAIIIALLIVILFDGGLHYFQTDSCKLFANYITGTCVSIFFLCISRISFSVNYNHFIQLKKIENNNQDITKVNEMQTEILSVVAHDLHAPINSVIGLTDILKNIETTPEERNEYYDLIIDTCKKSNSIIDELLNVARNDETETTYALTCMNDLIEGAIQQFIKSKKKSRQIIYRQPKEKIYAHVNHLKMVRVLDNLISNAIKFTNDDGTITVKMEHDAVNIFISVTDNGIGIPKDLIPHLFSRFSKAGRTGVHGEKSYGLGLSICKLIIKQHHGEITACSNEDKGTSITITLPKANEMPTRKN